MDKTERKNAIVDIIYNSLGYMYCDNCRFNSEIKQEEFEKENGYWGCEDCHRKYNGWGISQATAKNIAKKIMELEKECK